MASKVTIQDIADSLGLSRNTVSKAINNTGVLADATRERVLNKAMEMGYKQFSYLNISKVQQKPASPPENKGEIALLTGKLLGNSHFSSTMLDNFQREISQAGYSFTMHRLLEEEILSGQLPLSFRRDQIAGIICFEIFDYKYCQMLCGLDVPILFVDSPVLELTGPLKADLLYMDNRAEIFSFVREMAKRGKKKIGFIGNYRHCQSFFERYMNCRNALFLQGLSCSEEYFLIRTNDDVPNPADEDYREYLYQSLKSLKELPDVFLCANDFVALDTLQAFKRLGISVPEDVYLCGFDDSPESRIVTPTLTTIHIHSQIMGFSAAHLLLSRIEEPYLNYRTIYTETDLILRESTGD